MVSEQKLHTAYLQYRELIKNPNTTGPIAQTVANMFNVGVRELSDYIIEKDGKIHSTIVQILDFD